MIYVSILVALCPEHFILGTKGFGHPALWRQTLLRRVQHHVPCWQDQEDETSWTIECTWLFVLLPNCIVFLCISICTCTIWIMYRHSAIISSEFFTLLDFNGYFGTPKCGCQVRFFPSFVQVWTCGYEHEQSTRGTGRDVYDAHCVANSYLNWNRSTVYIYICSLYTSIT